MKSAPQWRVDGTGNLSFEDDFSRSLFGVECRSDRDKSPCVWVHGVIENVLSVVNLLRLSHHTITPPAGCDGGPGDEDYLSINALSV